jgi:hypothetical protein
MVSAEQYDPLSPAVHTDPYPFYRLFQSTCPVRHYRLTQEQVRRTVPEGNPYIAGPVEEVWMLFGHNDIRNVLQDPKTYSSLIQGIGLERTIAPNEVGMLNYSDPPHHGPQRAIVATALSPRLVKHMESQIAGYADDLIDGFIGRGECDIAAEYCDPLPGLMFCELLDLPASDQATFKRWSDDIIKAYGLDPEAARLAAVSMGEMSAYFLTLVAQRRELAARAAAQGSEPAQDLLTGLIVAEANGRRFDDSEIITALTLLIMAGNDTTFGALGHGVHLLCGNPDQLALLRREPDRLPNAVEEILRFDSPAGSLFRTTTRDVTLSGVDIPAGAKVGVAYGAANRDPEAFERPDEFDIGRPPAELRKHVTFGLGTHYCVGSALGRALVRIGLERLLVRLPDFRTDPDRPPVRHDALVARSFGHLYLRWTPPTVAPARGGS